MLLVQVTANRFVPFGTLNHLIVYNNGVSNCIPGSFVGGFLSEKSKCAYYSYHYSCQPWTEKSMEIWGQYLMWRLGREGV